MSEIRRLSEHDVRDVSVFLARGQRSPERYVGWLEEAQPDIEAQLSRITGRSAVMTEGENIVGYCGVEWADNSRTAWILPMGSDLDALFESGLKMLPAQTRTIACAFEQGNRPLASVCTSHGMKQTNAELLMTVPGGAFRRSGSAAAAGQTLVDILPYREVFRERLEEIHPATAHFTISEMAAGLDQRHYLFVVTLGGEVAGFCYATRDLAGTTGDITYVIVDEAFRRRGAATALVRHVLGTLFEDGAEHVELNVKVDNAAAIALYRKLGFTEVKTVVAYKVVRQEAAQP